MSSSFNSNRDVPSTDIELPSESSIQNSPSSIIFRDSVLKLGTFVYALIGILVLIYFSLGESQFRTILTLHDDVVFALNMSVNVLIYALPAFLAAFLGSLTRILLSSNDSVFSHFRILIGSGFIGVFTFLGLKSGIVFDILVGSVPNVKIFSDVEEKKAFYKLIVLCLLTGMFATTIFLTIEERVTNLANKIKHS